jgi:hypothetical protein
MTVCTCCVCFPLLCQALNLILLTAGEVRGLRESLRDVAASEAGQTNFNALYPCWSHSAGGRGCWRGGVTEGALHWENGRSYSQTM